MKKLLYLLFAIFLIGCSDDDDNSESTNTTSAEIGDLRDGGIVFWVDPDDNTHGLVCAFQEISNNSPWSNGSNITIGSTGTAIGSGAANTDAIIAAQGSGDYAASIARAYDGGGYTDWFLPSKYELGEMYFNKLTLEAVSGFRGLFNDYWCSSEYNGDSAWLIREVSINGLSSEKLLKSYGYTVHPIRAF